MVFVDTPSAAGTERPWWDISAGAGAADAWPGAGGDPIEAAAPSLTGGTPVVPPITPPLVGGFWLGEVGGD